MAGTLVVVGVVFLELKVSTSRTRGEDKKKTYFTISANNVI